MKKIIQLAAFACAAYMGSVAQAAMVSFDIYWEQGAATNIVGEIISGNNPQADSVWGGTTIQASDGYFAWTSTNFYAWGDSYKGLASGGNYNNIYASATTAGTAFTSAQYGTNYVMFLEAGASATYTIPTSTAWDLTSRGDVGVGGGIALTAFCNTFFGGDCNATSIEISGEGGGFGGLGTTGLSTGYLQITAANHSNAQVAIGVWGYESATAVNAVPEPEQVAMLLAGLGMLGFVARRRKSRR